MKPKGFLNSADMIPNRPYHSVTGYHREPGGLRRLDFFVDRIAAHCGDRDPSGYTVLDIGCGNGNISVPLAVLGYQVTGIDLSDAAVRAASKAAEDIGVQANFLAGGIETAPDGAFDAVVCSEVLEHQAEPENFIGQLKNKLRPDGRLFLSVPNGQSLEERLRRVLNGSEWTKAAKERIKKLLGAGTVQSLAQDPHVQFFSYHNLVELLRRSGLLVYRSENASVWFKEFFYIIGRAWMKRGSGFFHFLDSFDSALCAYWSRLHADGWLLESSLAGEGYPVLQLIPTLGMGGAERIALQLAEGLPQKGFSVITLAQNQGGGMAKYFEEKKLPVIILERKGFLKRWNNFWTLRRAIADLKPKILHTHLFGSDFWGRLAARSCGIRNIVTTEHNVNSDFSFVRNWALKSVRGLSVVYVAISRRVSDYLKGEIGVDPKKICVIYNGIDLGRIRKRTGTFFHDVPRLLFVGRLERQKNPELMLRALSTIRRPWTLTIAGDGELKEELKDLADELQIGARVKFLGLRDDIPEILADHDLFLFPSRWEGFGLAVLEAASSGLPVLAADLPVLREFLPEDRVTYLAPDDVAAWTACIESAMADPAPFLEKAQHAAAADWSRFSRSNMVDGYADVYRSILKGEL